MKMTNNHFNQLKLAILATQEQWEHRVRNEFPSYSSVMEIYRARKIPNGDRVKDLNMRYRWDLFHSTMRKEKGLLEGLYSYLSDNHIDTALKRIVKDIE